MKSNFKRLGDYIKEVKVRNVHLKAEKLLGINIDKFFMPSVANVVGTDMSVYKIVKNNQFACNRMHVGRDYRLPVSLSTTDEEFMVSPAYDVFEILNTETLYPEYLMMWFSRREFDRNAWFFTDADVRGGLHWKALCDMQLPIPSITKQREIVAEYNVIQNRIAINKELIQKLEETAQAIYKQWFVEFEFPDENGKPYKSNGGKMVWNEELQKEIPKGWEKLSLEKCIRHTNTGGDAVQKAPIVDYNTGIKCARVGDISQKREPYQWAFSKVSQEDYKKLQLRKNEILITRTATIGLTAFIDEDLNAVCNNGLIRAKVNEEKAVPLFLYAVMNTMEYLQFIDETNAGNSTRPNMKIGYLLSYSFTCPNLAMQENYIKLYEPIYKHLKLILKENFNLEMLNQVLFAKMSKGN